ncbi:MAG: DNA-binding protein WhiA [Bacilli bacterium]
MNEEKVPFAKIVKNEIALQSYSNEEKKFILSGFIRNGGAFTLGSSPSLSVHTEIACVAKLIYNSLKEVYSLKPTIEYDMTPRFGRRLVYLVSVHSDSKLYEVMEDLEISSDGGFFRMPPKEGIKRKNLRFLIIGSFLTNGSINNPNNHKTSYFLEMAFTDKADALAIKRKLSSFTEEKTMSFKYIKRREKHVIYLKKSDQISVFLSYIGATEAMLKYENARVGKDEINISNRMSICDTANYTKTLQTAKRDIDSLEVLLKYKPLALFDEKTRIVIEARMEKKDANYRELAEFITKDKGLAITKSGVVHTLTNLREEAEDFKK